MKNILYILSLFLFLSCEDKIDIDLDTAAPKLVVDASILWEKGTSGTNQKIKLTTTTNFYNATVPNVSGAIITVKNSANTTFNFIETPNTGEYICTNFAPVIGENYTLTITYQNQTYSATETLMATPPITTVEQTTVPGFTGNVIQVKYFYQDNGAQDNYYLTSFKHDSNVAKDYTAIKDEFFQGNEMFGFYSNDKVKQGDLLEMTLQGIDLHYFEYMKKILSMSGGQGGSPFATPAATVKGNIVNQTNTSNFPLGYFHLSEIDSKNYIVQ